MTPSVYHTSFLKKIKILFEGDVISDVIRLREEDGHLVNDVVFLALGAGRVAGFRANGMNPLISRNHVDDFDDFNLYALYTRIEKISQGFSGFSVGFSGVLFNPAYNEVVAIFLASEDFSRSILLAFSVDEVLIFEDCEKADVIRILKSRFLQFKDVDFLIFQRRTGDAGWVNADF